MSVKVCGGFNQCGHRSYDVRDLDCHSCLETTGGAVMAYEEELIDEMLYPLRLLNKFRKEGKFPSRKQSHINVALNWIEVNHPYPGFPSSEKTS